MSENFSFKVDPIQLETISKSLDGLTYKAPTVLKDAANKTGKKALDLLYKEVDNRYVYSGKGGKGSIKEFVKRKSATYANPRVIIDIKSNMTDLINFDVSHKYPLYWADPASWVRARVLKNSSKDHVSKFGNKAFVASFKSGHTAIVARVDSKHIKSLYGPSPTHMATKSWEQIEDQVNELLLANIDSGIGKVMGQING